MSTININKYMGGHFEPPTGRTFQMCEIIPPQSNPDKQFISNGYYSIAVDNSGSMNSVATVVDDDGDKVNHGWSLLDIAKHSLNTFIQSLDDKDWIYITSYSDNAVEVSNWTACTVVGKLDLQQKLYSIRPERATNMVAGLSKSFEAFETIHHPNASMGYHLLFTTDGIPSSHFLPPRGIGSFKPLVTNLLNKQRMGGREINVITMGLGNNVNSTLLTDICAGTGEFLHLPDPGCVGPFMVNLVAQCRTIAKIFTDQSLAVNMYLRVSPGSQVIGYEDITENRDGDSFLPLKHILMDSPRHIVVESTSSIKFGLYKKDINDRFIKIICSGGDESLENKDLVTWHTLRQMIVQNIKNNFTCDQWREALVESLKTLIRKIDEFSHIPAFLNMKNTVVNELLQGLSNSDNYKRWGRHYMRTLIPHLLRELRTNFRDEIMQSFSQNAQGEEGIFEKECNKTEIIFSTTQAPTPSLLNTNPCGIIPQPSGQTTLPDEFMRGGGCFHPDNTVERWNGSSWETIPITQVTPHNELKTPSGCPSEVKCIIKIPCSHSRAQFIKLGDLIITPWHPIRVDNNWVFPMEYSKEPPMILNCSWVYNLVMHNEHIIQVSGYNAVTLGHGFKGDVIENNFWGRSVINVLGEKRGWLSGYVILKESLSATMSNISRRSRRQRNSTFQLDKTIKKVRITQVP